MKQHRQSASLRRKAVRLLLVASAVAGIGVTAIPTAAAQAKATPAIKPHSK
jgi:hypothetical protein